MLYFSMSSLLMSVLFSNILLIMLYFIFKNTELIISIGYKLLAVFLILTLIRFVFPFEIFFSTNIYWPESLSHILTTIFITPHISFGSFELSVWQLFLVIWGIGTVIQGYRLIYAYRSIHKKILTFGTNISTVEPYRSLMNQICREYGKNNVFHVFEFPAITTPMIYGLKTPYIMLPNDYISDRQNLYYVLCHEAAHFFHHDLWLKLFSQILHVIFWWNPFAFFVKRQISTMLELRVDLHITASADSQRKTEYLECLVNASKMYIYQALEPTISFCNVNDSSLKQRIRMITCNSSHKKQKLLQCLFSFLFVGLYAFSILFTLERSSVSPEAEKSTMGVYEENSYLIENLDGGYDLYIEDMFMETYPVLDEYLPKLKIYKTLEEASNE